MKRKTVTITEEYNPDGTLATKITETIEEEDTPYMGGINPFPEVGVTYTNNPHIYYGDHGCGGSGTSPQVKVTLDGISIAEMLHKNIGR